MLSLFPQILFLAPLSAFLIRFALVVLFALSSWKHLNDAPALRIYALVEAALAALLLSGAWTQAVALVAALAVIAGLFSPRFALTNRTAALLALVMCISLVFTGAGSFAFDLPL